MSPVPLIARQRALSRIGEIRCGDEKHDGKVGRKLDTFRLTSQHREVLDRAAELYGGTVKEWEGPTGQAWQLITEYSTLPVLVIPGFSLRRSYEKWDGPAKRVRLCDGDEMADGSPCACNAVGRDECKIITRLMVLLPETGTALGWQVSSTGEGAADELDMAMRLADGIAQGRPFLPANLRLTQKRGQKNGKVTRWVQPVLDFNPQQNFAAGELPAGSSTPSEIPVGYTPVQQPFGNGSSLAEGLAAAETQTLARTPRVELPEDDVLDDDPGALATPPDASPSASAPAAPQSNLKPTKRQLDKLNVLVGTLREAGHIKTEQLYSALAKSRNVDVDTMVGVLEGAYTPDGVLHWSPLRDSLVRPEASDLIDRLERLEQNVGAAA